MTKLFEIDNKSIEVEGSVIPKETFEILREASSILENAKRAALEYRVEVASEVEQIKKIAAEEGYNDGLQELQEQILAYQEKIASVEEELKNNSIPIVIASLKKIIGDELSQSPERIADIIIQSIKPYTQHRNLTIYISPQDKKMVDKFETKIRQSAKHVERITFVVKDDLETGDCMISTEKGLINAKLSNQLIALQNALQSFKTQKS